MSGRSKFSFSFSGLLSVLVFLGGLATLLGWLGAMHWFFDLFAHFRVQYGIALILLGGLLFWLGSSRTAGLALLLAVFNAAEVLPHFLLTSPETAQLRTAVTDIRVLTQNVNARFGGQARVAEFIRREDADIVGVQEVSPQWQPMLDDLKDIYPHQLVVPRSDNFGIALLSKWPLIDPDVLYPGGVELPTLSALQRVGDTTLQIIVAHPPPPVRPYYAWTHAEIMIWLAEVAGVADHRIILGDLNSSRWSYRFKTLIDQGQLINSEIGFGLQPTWPMLPLPLWIPIDHVLFSKRLEILTRRIGPRVGSDHLGVVVDLRLPAG